MNPPAQFHETSRIVAKQRHTRSHDPAHDLLPAKPWTPSPPSEEPWRRIYLALSPDGQRRWDSLPPKRREQVFGL